MWQYRLQGYSIPRKCGNSGSSCVLLWPGTVHAYPDYNPPAKTDQHTVHAEPKFSRLGETRFHLTHRNKHRKHDKMGRQNNMPQMKEQEKTPEKTNEAEVICMIKNSKKRS